MLPVSPFSPFLTVNVDVVPSLYVIVYVSISPLVDVFAIDLMPLPLLTLNVLLVPSVSDIS